MLSFVAAPHVEGSRRPDSTPLPPPAGLSLPRRHVRLLVALLALVVAASSLALYAGLPRAQPSSGGPVAAGSPFILLYTVVGGGATNMTLPLVDFHNPANASMPNVTFVSWVHFSSGIDGVSEVKYSWIPEADSGLPVLVRYDPAEPLYSAGDQWFVVTPGGSCRDTCTQRFGWGDYYSNTTGIALWKFLVLYTVYRATLLEPTGSYSWLEVRYHLGVSVSGACFIDAYCLSGFNGTEPLASDLVPVGGATQLRADSRKGLEPTMDVHDFVDPGQVFHTTFSGPNFDAGPYGSIRTQLRSSFAWTAASDATFQLRGQGNLTVQMYIDTRFGGMYPVLVG